MRHVTTIALLALLSISVRALPQVPPAAATGSIEGVVLRVDNGAPVAGAQVTLTFALPATPAPQIPAARPIFQPVVTGADGKFSFKDVSVGGYSISATTDGYVRPAVGQGRIVFVAAGQILKDAAIRLVATGAVGGRVLDENGQPATAVPVQLVRAVYTAQGRSLQTVGTGAADDRGEYRVFGVPPGHYYVLAGTPPGPGARGRGGVIGSRFSLLYYPNAENIDQALAVEVKPGGQTSVDMRLRRQVQTTYRVRGRVVDGTGAGLPANLSVALSYPTGTTVNSRAFDPATGTFEWQNVAPGNALFVISIPAAAPTSSAAQTSPLEAAAAQAERQLQQASRPTGSVTVKVVDRDVDDVVITLRAGVNTTGRFIVDRQQGLSSIPNLDRLAFRLLPVTNIVNQPAPAVLPPSADGSFQVVGLREAEYRTLAGTAGVPDLYVKSATYGGEDILNKTLKYSGSGTGTFEVVLSRGAVPVTGTVTDSKSQPVAGIQVVLVPAQRTRVDLVRTSTTDQNGRFNFVTPNVPPGEYKLFSWESIDNGAYYDPEVLKQYDQQGKTLQVLEGSSPNVEVKLIPAP